MGVPSTHPLYLVAGGAVLAFVVYDVIITTLHRGGGPVTRLTTVPLWRLLIRTRVRGLTSHRLMSGIGIALVLFTVLFWIALLWLGWTLTFLGDASAVLHAEDEVPADLTERIYFTGFTIFTLGIGDFVPGSPAYRMLTVVASLSGFFIVTFAITYLMPVAQAAAQKRALADRIATFGRNPATILAHAWDGERLSGLDDVLRSVIEGLAQVRQDHLAYPVLHFFHSADPGQSLAVAVARLDEALWVVQAGSDRPLLVAGACGRWHEMVERLVDTLGVTRDGACEPPPPPPLEAARAAGVPLADDRTITERLAPASDARRRAVQLVRAHGWEWDAVLGETKAARGGQARRDLLDLPA